MTGISETHLNLTKDILPLEPIFFVILCTFLTYVASKYLPRASIVWSHEVCNVRQKVNKIIKKKVVCVCVAGWGWGGVN